MLSEPQFEESPTVAAMGEPHVVYLRYRLLPGDDAIEFRAPSLHIETDAFEVQVGPAGENVRGPFAVLSTTRAGDEANPVRIRREVEALVNFKTHHRSEREAHEAVQPSLEAWELDAALREPGQLPRFRFEFAGSLIVDRAPTPGEEAQYAVSGEGRFYVHPPDKEVVIDEYPRPPERFAADEHAVTLWQRWQPYLEGKDTLGAAAYACLTYIETDVARGERSAAAKLRISRGVFKTVRRLTSTVGDEATARKFGTSPRRPYTPAEIAFLEAAITMLIRRVGEVAAVADTASLPQTRLDDLPPF